MQTSLDSPSKHQGFFLEKMWKQCFRIFFKEQHSKKAQIKIMNYSSVSKFDTHFKSIFKYTVLLYKHIFTKLSLHLCFPLL